jgi:membrane protein YqaA with SNARE-associated domain
MVSICQFARTLSRKKCASRAASYLTIRTLSANLAAMHDWLTGYGYLSLFLLSFLASTLIPLGSEWLLIAMLLAKEDPTRVVAVATAGNFLGALSSYWIGLYGGEFLKVRVLRMDAATTLKAERLYGRFGSFSLLFSWLPVVGDPLCLIGGVLRVHLLRFSLLVFSGKLARYAAVAWLTLKGASL